MQREAKSLAHKAGAMVVTTGVLAASAWAQPPAPPLPATTAPAAPAVTATAPPPEVQYVEPESGGRIRRALRHAGRAIQANAIGYPKYFDEPPPGYYIHKQYQRMAANVNPHRFTVYRSDFLPGTIAFSPVGASRFNIMASRLAQWQGPVMIEWSPDEPELAEARRAAVVGIFQRAQLPITPERVVIAPSPFPGMLGSDAANNYSIMILRDRQAPSLYTTSPTSASGFGAGGGTGSPQ